MMKRPCSNWIKFCVDQRDKVISDRIKLDGVKLTFTETSYALSAIWRKMTDEEKRPYSDICAQANAEYQVKLQNLSKEEKTMVKRFKKHAKQMRKLTRPTPMHSGYIRFVAKERKNMTDGKSLKFEDVGRLLGSKWRELGPEERKVFIDESNQDALRYHAELKVMQNERKRLRHQRAEMRAGARDVPAIAEDAITVPAT